MRTMTQGPNAPVLPGRRAAAPPRRPARLSGPRLTGVALGWVVAYGALRIYWRLGHAPGDLSPVGTDLVVLDGWDSVGLCALALPVIIALGSGRALSLDGTARRTLLVAAGGVAIAFAACAALLLLDVIGAILPGLGIEFYPIGALSRSACLASGVLVALAARDYRRRTRAGCGACGGAAAPGPLDRTPRWAYAAAYFAVAGCLVRIAAQAAVGFGQNPMSSGVSAVLFEVGFVLGGSVLPLALVHSWGRTWPRWTPRAAGRRIPRRLVLWPGAGISGALVLYFGLMLLQMFWERLNGRNPFPATGGLDLPETFFWFAVPGYFAWGAGMAVAAVAYARRTRTACRTCGH
ncbi:hypothetical protein QP090_32870 [Actinomadura xylanilytica]|nr:hypothetical protein [Actinomadura xylanilytica]